MNKKPKRTAKKTNIFDALKSIDKFIFSAFNLVNSLINLQKAIKMAQPIPQYKKGTNESGLKIVNDYFNPGEIGVECIVLKDGSFSVISQGMNK